MVGFVPSKSTWSPAERRLSVFYDRSATDAAFRDALNRDHARKQRVAAALDRIETAMHEEGGNLANDFAWLGRLFAIFTVAAPEAATGPVAPAASAATATVGQASPYLVVSSLPPGTTAAAISSRSSHARRYLTARWMLRRCSAVIRRSTDGLARSRL